MSKCTRTKQRFGMRNQCPPTAKNNTTLHCLSNDALAWLWNIPILPSLGILRWWWSSRVSPTWVSERFNWRASSVRSRPTTYWQRWNSSSSRYSCSAVKEVRVRLGLSRSRPFGSTISRMVPLASVEGEISVRTPYCAIRTQHVP